MASEAPTHGSATAPLLPATARRLHGRPAGAPPCRTAGGCLSERISRSLVVNHRPVSLAVLIQAVPHVEVVARHFCVQALNQGILRQARWVGASERVRELLLRWN